MKIYGISERSFRLLLRTFETYPEIDQVLLFGSRAKGNYKNGSDIDLAIKGEKVGPDLIFRLKSTFNERLPIPYFVDVVGYENLDHKALKEHIERVGKVIYNLVEPRSSTSKSHQPQIPDQATER